ncbi:MAG: asparagine synthase (glutamine-hydrolyzing) [Pseudomonadota bacterium]
MCGLAGYIGSAEISSERIGACLKLMHRRGPDAEGVYRHCFQPGRHLDLVHTRLAIIDLDRRADQPFRLGSKIMIYNGELYNYLELKQELQNQGAAFKTDSDTEVLLQMLTRYGPEGLDRCEGMWALAVYDEADGSIMLSRDRFGEKPLCLFRDQTGLYFASEAKYIFTLSGRRLPVNLNHLRRYLVNGYRSLYKTRETFFLGLEELPAGHILTLNPNGRERLVRYWRPEIRPDESMSWQEAVEGAREKLFRAMKLRLRSDVPLAFCMSGGVDSNSLISVAKRVFDYDVHGFTIINTDLRYEEKDLVDYAVKELDIKHTYLPLNQSGFLTRLRELIRGHDAPVYTITYYVHWLLMQSMAEHGFKIAVSGAGADELFSGYYDHHLMYLHDVRPERGLFEASLADWEKHIRPLVRHPLLQDPLVFINHPGQRNHLYFNADVFAGYLRHDFSEGFLETKYCPELLRNRMLNELFEESVPVILHEDDLNAMYYSLENRSPYLDRELFEFCGRIPTRRLISDGYTKKVLRDAMHSLVPEKILAARVKVGFNAPILSLLDLNDPEVKAYLLDQGPIFEHVRRESIAEIISQQYLSDSESLFLFYFLCAKMFLEEFSG